MSFTRSESERLARLKGCTTGIYCRYGRPTGAGITGPTGPAGYSFFTLGGNQGSLTPSTGSIIVVNMSGTTGSVGYSDILQASQAGYTGSAPTPSPYLKVDSDIIPAKNNVYSIGSANMQFKSAYFGANTVYIDGVPIGATGGTTLVMPQNIQIGQTLLTASGDTLVLPTNVRLGSLDGPLLGDTTREIREIREIKEVRDFTDSSGRGGGPDGGMKWIDTNLLGHAPPIVINDVKIRSSEIFIGWTYPTQVKLSFIDVWVPAINGFSAELHYVKDSDETETTKRIFNNENSDKFIDYRLATANKPITGIILTNVNTNNNVYNENGVWHDATTRALYRYYHPDFEQLKKDSNFLIKLWYSNYSVDTATGVQSFSIFLPGGPPGVPRDVHGTKGAIQANNTYRDNTSAATLTYKHPLYVDMDDYNSTATIQKYTVMYTTHGSPRRYGGAYADSKKYIVDISNTYTDINQVNAPIIISGLYPDCTYEFDIFATNSAEMDGSGTKVYVEIDPLSAPPKLSGLTLEPTQFYKGAIKRVHDGLLLTSSTGLLLNLSPDKYVKTCDFSSPIQHMDNRGSTASDIMRISASFKNINGDKQIEVQQKYSGFPAPVKMPEDVSADGICLQTLAIADANTLPQKKGFYLKATNRVCMDISGNIAPSPEPYVMEIKHEYTNSTNTTTSVAPLKMFYDEQPQPPTLVDISFTFDKCKFCRISGIHTIISHPEIGVKISLRNMGHYFYRIPYLTIVNDVFGISDECCDLTPTNYIGGDSLPEILQVDKLVKLNIENKYATSIYIDIEATNVLTTKQFSTISVPVITDIPSYRLISDSVKTPPTIPVFLLSSSNSSSEYSGFRIKSGVSLKLPENMHTTAFFDPDIPYDHNDRIDTTEELQIYNGLYRTKGQGTTGYLDYTRYTDNSYDYTTIESRGYRYATFKWEVGNLQGDVEYSALTFVIHGVDARKCTVNPATNIVEIGGEPLLLFYRFVEGDARAPTDNTSMTSAWINANSRMNEVLSDTYYTPSDNSITLGGKSNKSSILDNNKIIIPVKLPKSFGCAVSLYSRICLPMDKEVEFEYISAILRT